MIKVPQNVSKDMMAEAIEQWIIGPRCKTKKAIFTEYMLVGSTFEEISEKFNYSSRHVQSIIHECENRIFPHLPG